MILIEKQSGRVTRHLIKSQERFDIENTKLMKREKKIVQRFEEHVDNVSVCLKEMERKRRLCFIVQEEDVVQEERDADRVCNCSFHVVLSIGGLYLPFIRAI